MVNKNSTSISLLLAAAVFFIPVWPTITSVIWGIAILVMFVNKRFRFSFAPITGAKYLFPLILLYLLHIVGLIWTTDLAYGIRDLWIKIPMIIFPFLFCFYKPSDTEISIIKTGLVLGCLTACLICLVKASINFMADGELTNFLYVNYSFLIFPGYFSICLNFCILLLLQMKYAGKLFFKINYKYFIPTLVVFFVLNILLISEKMSLLTTIATVPLFIVLEEKRKNNLRVAAKKLIMVAVLFIILFVGYLKVYDRFSQVTDAIKSFRENDAPRDESYYNSSTIRLAEWKYGYEIFQQNLFIGVGTGDIKIECIKKYEDEKFQYGIAHFETPASQYLHITMILGLLGLIGIIVAYFFPLYVAIINADNLYIGFTLVFIFNSITGTILTGSAVLLYGFYNAMLYFLLMEKTSKEHADLK